MEAKKFGNAVILWGVYDLDEENEEIRRALFKDPNKAAIYAIKHRYIGGVRMCLFDENLHFKTMD